MMNEKFLGKRKIFYLSVGDCLLPFFSFIIDSTHHYLCKFWDSLWRNWQTLTRRCFLAHENSILSSETLLMETVRVSSSEKCCAMMILMGKLEYMGRATPCLEPIRLECEIGEPIPLSKSLIVGFDTHQTVPLIKLETE